MDADAAGIKWLMRSQSPS